MSPTAFGCFGLHYVQNTPIVTLQTNQQYSVSFMFEHDNPGGTYTCFLRDGESCPPVTNNTDCDEGQNITFTNLNPGVWFNCGVRCRFGNTLRTISRSFATPSQPVDCNAMLINDGISFLNYTMEGNATTCFMWSSSGSPSGFECRIDDGTPFDCKSSSAWQWMLLCVLGVYTCTCMSIYVYASLVPRLTPVLVCTGKPGNEAMYMLVF